MVDKKSIWFVGTAITIVNIFTLFILIYYGYRSGLHFFDIIQTLLKELNIAFYFINFILIVFCTMLKSKLILKFYSFLLILSIILAVLNIYFIPKNFLSIFNTIFWVFYLLFLYFNKKALKTKKGTD